MSGGMGEGFLGDPPGSFGAMSESEKLDFTIYMNTLRERRKERERLVGYVAATETIELKGDEDEREE